MEAVCFGQIRYPAPSRNYQPASSSSHSGRSQRSRKSHNSFHLCHLDTFLWSRKSALKCNTLLFRKQCSLEDKSLEMKDNITQFGKIPFVWFNHQESCFFSSTEATWSSFCKDISKESLKVYKTESTIADRLITWCSKWAQNLLLKDVDLWNCWHASALPAIYSRERWTSGAEIWHMRDDTMKD